MKFFQTKSKIWLRKGKNLQSETQSSSLKMPDFKKRTTNFNKVSLRVETSTQNFNEQLKISKLLKYHSQKTTNWNHRIRFLLTAGSSDTRLGFSSFDMSTETLCYCWIGLEWRNFQIDERNGKNCGREK